MEAFACGWNIPLVRVALASRGLSVEVVALALIGAPLTSRDR